MKRALVLLMVGSLVLAGCLASETNERNADDEPFELSATEEWRNNTV
jgi:nitrous oxide reductase accessory protein NosL